jgi:hypothetical protein
MGEKSENLIVLLLMVESGFMQTGSLVKVIQFGLFRQQQYFANTALNHTLAEGEISP